MPTRNIDLRSDTVTQPDAKMRQIMANAQVGDDVFGEDPTIIELQEKTAALVGKEAGLFVPSGTMSNQLAIKTHTQPGDEVICHSGAHILHYEAAGPAVHSGVQLAALDGPMGVFTAGQVDEAVRPVNVHMPLTRLISVENTHNRAGGTIFPLEELQSIAEVAEKHNLAMHMDGARLLNAVVASGISAKDWSAPFQSVSICLSKGLGAPVGSVLCADKEFIVRAHRYRKLFGGGMRQAGIIAAAGIYALENHIDDLAKDHEHAQALAKALASQPGIIIDPADVHTNIVIFEIEKAKGTAEKFEKILNSAGILCLAFSRQKIRLVTHRDLAGDDIDYAINIIKKVMA